jgi:S1-C subfamily serine protease
MRDSAIGSTGQAAPGELNRPDAPRPDAPRPDAPRPDGHDTAGPGPARPKTGPAGPHTRPKARRSRRSRVVASIAGGALGIAVGFSVGAVIKFVGSNSAASSVIPSPPRANARFVEDDNGTGQDNQENILAAAAPGLVRIISSRGTSVGLGVVLTPSGLVLTSDQILRGAGPVTVQIVLSGKSFAGRVAGSDDAEDLALLQIEGGSRFKPIAIGNSRDFAIGAQTTAVSSNGATKTLTLNLGNVTSLNAAATIGGTRLTRLLRVTAQTRSVQETGGPLVNLSGQAVGIDLAGAGSGLHSAELAMPIDTAISVARQIDAKHS